MFGAIASANLDADAQSQSISQTRDVGNILRSYGGLFFHRMSDICSALGTSREDSSMWGSGRKKVSFRNSSSLHRLKLSIKALQLGLSDAMS
jgi:hypothetical protein